jgi:hypothetical protein
VDADRVVVDRGEHPCDVRETEVADLEQRPHEPDAANVGLVVDRLVDGGGGTRVEQMLAEVELERRDAHARRFAQPGDLHDRRHLLDA